MCNCVIAEGLAIAFIFIFTFFMHSYAYTQVNSSFHDGLHESPTAALLMLHPLF